MSLLKYIQKTRKNESGRGRGRSGRGSRGGRKSSGGRGRGNGNKVQRSEEYWSMFREAVEILFQKHYLIKMIWNKRNEQQIYQGL